MSRWNMLNDWYVRRGLPETSSINGQVLACASGANEPCVYPRVRKALGC